MNRFLGIKRIKWVPVFLILTLIFHSPASARMVNYSFDGVVMEVVDGDTFLLETTKPYTPGLFRVRLYGVYAPVINGKGWSGQSYAAIAKTVLQGKLEKQKVRVEVREVDQSGRQLGLVYLGSRNINEEMLREGWGWYWRAPEHRAILTDEDDYLRKVCDDARTERKGLWRENNPKPPWVNRRNSRETVPNPQ